VDIQIDRESPVPVYLQISRSIKDMILKGTLPENFRLPPERTLAGSLGVHRTTVINAYRELKSDGLVDSHVGRGTAVLGGARPESKAPDFAALRWSQLIRASAAETQDQLLRDLLDLTDHSGVIILSLGLPAPELIPVDTVRRISAEVLEEGGPSALLHSPTEGLASLRSALARLMQNRGIPCPSSEVLVTSGSQQAIDILARVFVDPGDPIVVEEPSYFGALRAFRAAQARLIGVPTDAKGMRTDMLEALLARQRPKFIYTLPTYQNPSGALMSMDRRRHLLELAYRYRVPIVEDDLYCDLRYEGEAIPPIKALDRNGFVIYVSSFSKILFPGLRVGWMAAPSDIARQIVLTKQVIDLHTTTFGQMVMERFLRGGAFEKHVRSVRAEYERRRDTMDEALRAHMPRGVSWEKPHGGFYFWCRFPGSVSRSLLLTLARETGVSYLPGSACFPRDTVDNYIRLNFSLTRPELLSEGVARLAAAFRRAFSEKPHEGAYAQGGTPPIV